MAVRFEKGFQATLFDCIDIALTSVLGKESVRTFYYSIAERFNIPLLEFQRRPLEILDHFQEVLGETAFKGLEPSIISSIRVVFQIREDKSVGLSKIVELAKDSYLRAEM